LTIDGGFENHFIIRISKSRPPPEVKFDRLDQCSKLTVAATLTERLLPLARL
jgi:hypothetical protein